MVVITHLLEGEPKEATFAYDAEDGSWSWDDEENRELLNLLTEVALLEVVDSPSLPNYPLALARFVAELLRGEVVSFDSWGEAPEGAVN